MSKRYRITRELQENGTPSISLEECKRYFASQPDFSYTPVLTVKDAAGTRMSIEGEFFMWSFGDAQIPFRHYGGDIYVSGSNEAVIPKMMEVAGDLGADVMEG